MSNLDTIFEIFKALGILRMSGKSTDNDVEKKKLNCKQIFEISNVHDRKKKQELFCSLGRLDKRKLKQLNTCALISEPHHVVVAQWYSAIAACSYIFNFLLRERRKRVTHRLETVGDSLFKGTSLCSQHCICATDTVLRAH